jgi:hypothetical protein
LTTRGLPYACLFALAAALFGPFLVDGRLLWSQDIARVYYPVAHLLKETLRTGDLSRLVWCPELGAGFPLAADGVSTPFYPLHWALLALLPPASALTAGLFVAYLGAGLAMAGFARTLGLGRAAAALAGAAYAWSGFAVGHSVHVNVVAGLPFLPLILLFLEKAAGAAPFRHAAAAGVCFGLQCLGGHPQVALMSAALGAAYALLRLRKAPTTRPAWSSPARPLAVVAVFVAVGAGLSAVYYLPMSELAQQSVRPEGGLSRAQAVAYALPAPHLVTAVSPFFFFDAATGEYQGAWNPAEMALYPGLVVLILAGLALVARRGDRLVLFLAAVVAVSLLLALGDATPLHGLLHSLPVFRGLRAPARYVLLANAALAVLAALGLEALRGEAGAAAARRLRTLLAAAAVLALALPFAEPLWRGRLAGDGWRDAAWAQGVPALLAAKAWLPLVWLALFAVWAWRRPGAPSSWWPAAGAALAAADLGAFAATSFSRHWVRPETALARDPAHALAASAAEGRVYVVSGSEPWRQTSDLPLVYGFPSLNAYVSLPLARHSAYVQGFWMADQAARGLLDAAAVTTVVDSWRRPLDPRSEVAGHEFSPRSPLAALGAGERAAFDLGGAAARRLEVVTSLEGAAALPQDAEVARVTLHVPSAPPLAFRLRAGRETAERAHGAGAAHAAPAPRVSAWSLVDRRSDGFFYLSRLPLPETRPVTSLEVEYTAPAGRLLLFGAAVVDASGARLPVTPFLAEGYRRGPERSGARLHRNPGARPRAYAVHAVDLASSAAEAVERLASGRVRPETAVVLEDASAPRPASGGPSQVVITRDTPRLVELRATMQGSGYVVLADTYYPGWEARVDGSPAPVYAANGSFRAVFVGDGSHQVVFTYPAGRLRAGAAITAAALLAALALWLAPRKR